MGVPWGLSQDPLRRPFILLIVHNPLVLAEDLFNPFCTQQGWSSVNITHPFQKLKSSPSSICPGDVDFNLWTHQPTHWG
jgi:hypothetical protein